MVGGYGYIKMMEDIERNFYDYIRKPSLSLLHIFLGGFSLCASFSPSRDCMWGIQNFIERKYLGGQRTTRHYLEIINSHHFCEKEAFYKYFELFKEFLKEKNNSPSTISSEINLPPETNDPFKGLTLDEIYYWTLGYMRIRPGVYFLDVPCIRNLEAFLSGFHICATKNKLTFNPHQDFDLFVKKRYGYDESGNEFDALSKHHTSEEAFHEFFKLLGEFLTDNDKGRCKELYDLRSRKRE